MILRGKQGARDPSLFMKLSLHTSEARQNFSLKLTPQKNLLKLAWGIPRSKFFNGWMLGQRVINARSRNLAFILKNKGLSQIRKGFRMAGCS
jgi:hypothetical protein